MPTIKKLDAILRNQLADALDRHRRDVTAAGLTYRPDRVLEILIEASVGFAVERGVAMKPKRPARPSEALDALLAVRTFIERHWPSRIHPIGLPATDTSSSAAGEPRSEPVGYCRFGASGPVEFLFTTASWRVAVCAGRNASGVAKILHDRGFLSGDAVGRLSRMCRLPGHTRPTRCYVVSTAIMAGTGIAESVPAG